MKDLSYFYENAISINDFLAKYYGRSDFDGKKLIHENVKSLFPDIKRWSFEDIVKNPELVYTGKVVLVRDSNNRCIPYLTGYDFNMVEALDNREKLIVELVSAIDKLLNSYNNGLIILENNDSISSNVIGSTIRNIKIVDDEIVKLNNSGGILIKNPKHIYTFDYLITKLMNLKLVSYSKNNANASNLSKEKDIISISLKDSGRVFITSNGITHELTNLMEIRNFLLKSYSPRKEVEINSDLDNVELDFLLDYELEKLKVKYKKEKNGKMYFKVKMELNKRYKNRKKENKKYREEKQKVKIKKMEEY